MIQKRQSMGYPKQDYMAQGKSPLKVRAAGLSGKRLLTAGLALAAAGLFVRYKTMRAEQENPPQGKFVEVDGIRLHYVEKGQGQPLVLLHGNTTMALDFCMSPVFDMAARNYRVIVFDRPGYGYSERPRSTIWGPQAQARLLHDALMQIDVHQPVVLGHSWGALVAMALALDFPQSVKSLVLMSGYYYPTIRPDIPIASQPAIPVIGDIMRYTISPLMFRMNWPLMLKRIFKPGPVPEHFRQFPVWMALRPSQVRASAVEIALIIPSVMSLRKRYHELNVPLIIMAGSEDRLVYVDRHSARLHAELPMSDFRLVEGVGHMVQHVAPDHVMEAIDAAANASAVPALQRGEAVRTESDHLH
jgi:pimeloyl-ACP methyl ester carboxylesterase